jgi:hypothetical protein
MRARYYEQTSWRFVSEDSARDRTNWYAYCSSNPVNKNDKDGKVEELTLIGGFLLSLASTVEALGFSSALTTVSGQRILIAGAILLWMWINESDRSQFGDLDGGLKQVLRPYLSSQCLPHLLLL